MPKYSLISQYESLVSMCLTTLCRDPCENGWTDRFAVLGVDSGGPKEAEIQMVGYSAGVANVHKFSRIRQMAPMYPTTLCRELCKKQLNRSICRLGCGIGCTSSIVFDRWRQCYPLRDGYWPKCGDALRMGSKGRHGSVHLWIKRVHGWQVKLGI